MNNSRYHLLFLLLLSCYAIQAQKNGSSFIGIEAGLLDYFGDSKEQDFIRKEYNSWYSTSDSYASTFNAYYAGIKYEQLIKQDRIGWMTGLRFTKSQSSRGANESWLNDGDYFYVLYKSENTSTEYLKVREIQQETYYIGVPLEIRYLLFGARFFRLYFKLGTEFNFRINTSNHFDFVNKSMNVYQQDLSDWVEKPGVSVHQFMVVWECGLARNTNPQ